MSWNREHVQADERQYINAGDDTTCQCGTPYKYSLFRGFYCPKCQRNRPSHHGTGKRGRRDGDGGWK